MKPVPNSTNHDAQRLSRIYVTVWLTVIEATTVCTTYLAFVLPCLGVVRMLQITLPCTPGATPSLRLSHHAWGRTYKLLKRVKPQISIDTCGNSNISAIVIAQRPIITHHNTWTCAKPVQHGVTKRARLPSPTFLAPDRIQHANDNVL
jgi:hypothetical protein